MKKLLTICLIFTLALVLVACSGGSDTTGENNTGGTTPEATTEAPQAPLVVFMTEGASEYTVLYPILMSQKSELGQAVEELKTLTADNAGNPFTFKSDYEIGVDDYSIYNGAKEILIGATNRLESTAVVKNLRYDDYVICVKDGKLVIAGGSDEATAKAVKRFSAMFFSQTQPALILPENYLYEKNGEYPLDSLTIGDKSVADYTVVYDAATKKDALALVDKLQAISGYTLTATDKADGVTNAIKLTASTDKGSFLSLKDGALTLSGDTELNRSLAVQGLIKVIESQGKNPSLDATLAQPTLTKGSTIKVFDLSVYSAGYGVDSVNNRYPRLMTLIDSYKPTVLCLQDVSPTWIENMTKGNGSTPALTDKFDYVGVGRNNDKDSVMQAIFFDKSLYALKGSGTFWLSETPEWESVGWDGRTRSICTWAILTEKASGKDFAVMNTALDPYGTKARVNGIALILEHAKAFGLPVIFGGNMEATDTSTHCKLATERFFCDSEKMALTVGETGKTINVGVGSGEVVRLKSASDFVYTSYGDFIVDSYTLIKDLVDNEYVSNHWPILTEVSLAD